MQSEHIVCVCVCVLQVADKFVEQCSKSLGELCRRQGLSWQVTPCGWSEEERSDRTIR